jgi:UDP-glucose 4-epimerase
MDRVRVVVAGGAGYIGSVVAALLVERGHDVMVLDDLSTGHRHAVPAGATFVEGSIRDQAMLAAVLPGADAVLHFAALSVVPDSMREPDRYWQANVAGSLALLEGMRTNGVRRIVFSSSAAVYGDAGDGLIDEDAPARPTSPYGATKLAVDLALADFALAYQLAAVSLRYFNVAGALHQRNGASFGEWHRPESHLIPLALRAAAGEAAELSLYGTDYPTPDGTCIRDYVHVVDLADAHIRALSAATAGTHVVVNLGSGAGYSVRQVLATIEQVTGRRVPVAQRPRRAGDPARLVAAITRAEKLLGWRPRRDLTAMITDASRQMVTDASRLVVTDASRPVVTDASRPVVTDAWRDVGARRPRG